MSPLTDPQRINERLDSIGFLIEEPSLSAICAII
jgi:DNA mismatch repair protein MutS